MTFAIVRFRVPGLHNWPGATAQRKYLANDHRHIFHVECGIEEFHNDREVEYHDLLDIAQEDFILTGPMSCEMAATRLLEHLQRRFPNRRMYVDVFEDGECGTRVTNETVTTKKRKGAR